MGRVISTYYTDDDKGHCEVKLDSRNEQFYIKYYDDQGRVFFNEEYPNKTLEYVNTAAEEWTQGIKKLVTDQPYKNYTPIRI